MPADFGTDLGLLVDEDGQLDLDPTFGMVSGAEVLRQALACRFVTPGGGLFYDEGYGLDLRDYLNLGTTPRGRSRIAALVQGQCLKDERVDDAQAEVHLQDDGTLVVIVGVDSAAGPFDLVLAVSDLTVSLLASEAP